MANPLNPKTLLPAELKHRAKAYEKARSLLEKEEKQANRVLSPLKTQVKERRSQLLTYMSKQAQHRQVNVRNYRLAATVKQTKTRLSEKMLLKHVKGYCTMHPNHRSIVANLMQYLESKRHIKTTTFLSRRKIVTPSKRKKAKRRAKKKRTLGKPATHVDWHRVLNLKPRSRQSNQHRRTTQSLTSSSSSSHSSHTKPHIRSWDQRHATKRHAVLHSRSSTQSTDSFTHVRQAPSGPGQPQGSTMNTARY